MSHTPDATRVLRQHAAMQLPDELAFIRQFKSEWLATHRGQFVLIGKQTFAGFHPSYEGALHAGTRMFGLIAPFLIEEIRD